MLTNLQNRATALGLDWTDLDAFIDGAEGPCPVCDRWEAHGHSGYELGQIGGDGDYTIWYIPAVQGPEVSPEQAYEQEQARKEAAWIKSMVAAERDRYREFDPLDPYGPRGERYWSAVNPDREV